LLVKVIKRKKVLLLHIQGKTAFAYIYSLKIGIKIKLKESEKDQTIAGQGLGGYTCSQYLTE
jgi:hypothetical protein